MGFDTDLRELEAFADEKYQTSVHDRVPGALLLKSSFAEARQTVNLFTATQPDLFLNPVIRERNYNAFDVKKIILIGEKFKDLPEKIFGGGRSTRVLAKKKPIDALVKRLKNES